MSAWRLAVSRGTKGKKASEWRKVIDACPDRPAHLLDALRARLAADEECGARDDWNIGMGSILRCLAHTFGLTDEDIAEFALDAESERDHPDIHHQPPYRGGNPRIPETSDDVGFYSTRDLEELVWSRGSELDSGDSLKTVISAHLANGGAEWSLSLWSERFGETGLWKTSYSLDGDFDQDFVLGLWSAYGDTAARIASTEEALRSWWWRFLYEREGADTWSLRLHDRQVLDPASLSEYLARWCMDSEMQSTWKLISTWACRRVELFDSIPTDLWRILTKSSNVSDWWSAPSPEAAEELHPDEGFVRELAGFFVATFVDFDRSE